MRLPRIYLSVAFELGAELELPEASRHHLTQVLRLASGDRVLAFNGVDAVEARLELVSVTRKSALARILAVEAAWQRESPLRTTLVQSVCNSERMDYALQKCVELGISFIQPVYTERGHPPLETQREEKKRRHWEGVVVSACEQSGRVLLPHVGKPQRLADYLLNRAGPLTLVMLAPDARLGLDAVNPEGASLEVCVGPEGGWSEAEIALITAAGGVPVRFGPRVLRCETAGPAFLAWAQARFGDVGAQRD